MRLNSLDFAAASALRFVNLIYAKVFNQRLSLGDYRIIGDIGTELLTEFGHPKPVSTQMVSLFRLDASQTFVSYKVIRTYFSNSATSNSSVIYLFVCLGLIILIGLLCGVPPLNNRLLKPELISKLRGRFTLPAVPEKHAQPSIALKGLLPTRLEIFIIIGYMSAHLGAMLVHYEADETNTESPKPQILRSMGDRMGILCFAQLPLIILFSGRNSFLEELSGLRYTTPIVLHKWIGRVMMTDAIGHAYIYVERAKVNETLVTIHRKKF